MHRKAVDVALQVVAADDVEDDVHALAFGRFLHHLDEVRRPGPTIRIYKRLEASTAGSTEPDRGTSR